MVNPADNPCVSLVRSVESSGSSSGITELFDLRNVWTKEFAMKKLSDSPHANHPSCWHPTRRDFLKASTGLLATMALGPFSCQSLKCFPRQTACFGMVTDIHYADINTRIGRHYRDSIGKLNECTDLMNTQKVDFLMELGDFKDQDDNPTEGKTIEYLQTIETIYQNFQGPTYHVLGNHDMDSISKKQFLTHIQNTGIAPESSYYSFAKNRVHFIVLDANFSSDGKDYDHGKFDWTDTNIPPAQLDWLRNVLKSSDKPAIVFSHQRLDGVGSVYIKNAAQVCQVLEDSGKVLAVFHGHHHEGGYNRINNIHYYTLQAVVDGPAPENNSYAIVEVLPDLNITVTGYRKAVPRELHKSITVV